jgi:hypothetical protein
MTPEAPLSRPGVSDATPSVGLREYLHGARPLVGTIAASSLMLLACSWFALETGHFGGSQDVGGPDAVQIDDSAGAGSARDAGALARDGRRPASIRSSHPVSSVATRETRRRGGHATHGAAATGRPPVSEQSKPTSTSTSRPDAPQTSDVAAAPAAPPVVSVETTLPPPLDQVEVPSLPSPPSLPVTPPALPVPAVPPTTVSVGVP